MEDEEEGEGEGEGEQRGESDGKDGSDLEAIDAQIQELAKEEAAEVKRFVFYVCLFVCFTCIILNSFQLISFFAFFSTERDVGYESRRRKYVSVW